MVESFFREFVVAIAEQLHSKAVELFFLSIRDVINEEYTAGLALNDAERPSPLDRRLTSPLTLCDSSQNVVASGEIDGPNICLAIM